MVLLDICSVITAGLALVVSYLGWKTAKKAEKVNHEFALFQGVYQDHLVYKLPAARSQIQVTQNGVISGVDGFIQELNEIRKDSLYFQYANPNFFEQLRNCLWGLEDYLTLLEGPLVNEARLDFEETINKKMIHIYKCILQRF